MLTLEGIHKTRARHVTTLEIKESKHSTFGAGISECIDL